MILNREIFSVRPYNPIPVVMINTTGPTNARRELIYKAFSKSFSLNINNAADTSILPDNSLNITIKINAFSIRTANASPSIIHF